MLMAGGHEMTYGRDPLHTLATHAAADERRIADANLASKSRRRSSFDEGSEIDGSGERPVWGTRILHALRRALGH